MNDWSRLPAAPADRVSKGSSAGGRLVVEAVPAELREQPWVVWRREVRGGRPTKPPRQPRRPDRYARVDDPTMWGTLAEALAAVKRGAADGIGFVLVESAGLVAVDLDDCADEAGELHPAAAELVAQLGTYSEWSPSGRGLHVVLRGSLTGGRNRTGDTPWRGALEAYDHRRFITFTGRRLPGSPATVEERQAELDDLVGRYLTPQVASLKPAPAAPLPSVATRLLDDELLARAGRARNGALFTRLWTGATSDYPSPSEADLALCGLLAFWTRADPEAVDRLFRLSGLMRAKWDELRGSDGETYGSRTIARALAGCRAGYDPAAYWRRLLDDVAAATDSHGVLRGGR